MTRTRALTIPLASVAIAIGGCGGDDDGTDQGGGAEATGPIDLAPVEKALASEFGEGVKVSCPNNVQPADKVEYDCTLSGAGKGKLSVTQRGDRVNYTYFTKQAKINSTLFNVKGASTK